MSHYLTLTSAQIEAGTDQAIADARAVLDELAAPKDRRTFENTMKPLDHIADILAHATTKYSFPGYVHSDKEVRAAAKTS